MEKGALHRLDDIHHDERPNTDLRLNVLTVEPGDFAFEVYTRNRIDGEQKPADSIFSAGHSSPHHSLWMSFDPFGEFQPRTIVASDDLEITSRFVFHSIVRRLSETYHPNDFKVGYRFPRNVAITIRRTKYGSAQIILQPQAMPLLGRVGIIVDFHFKTLEEYRGSRDAQRLSYSLDSQYRANRNFHIDKHREVEGFIKEHADLFVINGAKDGPLRTEPNFLRVQPQFLQRRTFICGGEHEAVSAREGLQAFGPYQRSEQFTLYFIFREPEREEARRVLMALQGTSFQRNFPGFKTVFGIDTTNAFVKGKAISGPNIEALIAEHITECKNSPMPTMTITVFPQEDQEYVDWKKQLTQAGLPMQQIDKETALNPNSLKFAAYNIAVQIFAKAGGVPWIMKTANRSTLIIGFGQAHDSVFEDGQRIVRRYLAYSVLTDASGRFQKVAVLAQSDRNEDYLRQLLETTTALLREQSTKYDQIVLHIPFRFKQAEMQRIRDCVRAQSVGCFVVMRVNDETRFFGYDYSVNSLVPHSAAYVQVQPEGYLVWYEGITSDSPTVSKRYAGPLFVSFDYSSSQEIDHRNFLQDIINLSGANWRGLGAGGLPVSIRYCQFVAKFLKRFEQSGFEIPNISTSIPWFL